MALWPVLGHMATYHCEARKMSIQLLDSIIGSNKKDSWEIIFELAKEHCLTESHLNPSVPEPGQYKNKFTGSSSIDEAA